MINYLIKETFLCNHAEDRLKKNYRVSEDIWYDKLRYIPFAFLIRTNITKILLSFCYYSGKWWLSLLEAQRIRDVSIAQLFFLIQLRIEWFSLPFWLYQPLYRQLINFLGNFYIVKDFDQDFLNKNLGKNHKSLDLFGYFLLNSSTFQSYGAGLKIFDERYR